MTMNQFQPAVWMILAMAFVATSARAEEKPAEEPAGQARVFEDAQGRTMPYRIFAPPNLEKGKTYPLVLCFHGAKGRGTDNKARGTLAYEVLTSDGIQKQFPAFILAPQCPSGKRWVNVKWGDGAYDSKKVAISDEMVLALSIVDRLITELPIDQTRIYVTGRSMGGFACWDAIARRPGFFAAAVPIAGGGDPQRAAEWRQLPIWAIASAGDQTCPVSGTRVVVEALKKEGANIKYTEDPKKNHGAICMAWRDQEGLAEWLFSQKRTDQKPEAQREHRLHREIKNLVRPSLLIIDEVGYLTLDTTQASLLFQVIAERYAREQAIVRTSNKAFAEWAQVFARDAVMASAALDRLLHRATVLNIRPERGPQTPGQTKRSKPTPNADGKEAST